MQAGAIAADDDVEIFVRPWELQNLTGFGMDVHVQISINLQVAAVHNLYFAEALGCIVDGHGLGHGYGFAEL